MYTFEFIKYYAKVTRIIWLIDDNFELLSNSGTLNLEITSTLGTARGCRSKSGQDLFFSQKKLSAHLLTSGFIGLVDATSPTFLLLLAVFRCN